MTSKLRAFGAFWYDFIVGDDWRVAAGVVLALALIYGLSTNDTTRWWIMPIAVALLLPASIYRITRQRS